MVFSSLSMSPSISSWTSNDEYTKILLPSRRLCFLFKNQAAMNSCTNPVIQHSDTGGLSVVYEFIPVREITIEDHLADMGYCFKKVWSMCWRHSRKIRFPNSMAILRCLIHQMLPLWMCASQSSILTALPAYATDSRISCTCSDLTNGTGLVGDQKSASALSDNTGITSDEIFMSRSDRGRPRDRMSASSMSPRSASS